MRIIELDVSGCRQDVDFVDALRDAVQAPDGHGSGIDAFIDSMIYGGMNDLEPPYTLRILGTQGLPKTLVDMIEEFVAAINSAAENRGTAVKLAIVS